MNNIAVNANPFVLNGPTVTNSPRILRIVEIIALAVLVVMAVATTGLILSGIMVAVIAASASAIVISVGAIAYRILQPRVAFDVCDLNRIYNKEFEYSLPRTVLEGFLSGKAFDNPNKYSAEELQNLKTDIRELMEKILSRNPIKKPLAVITAGGPGAGKTIKMRQDLDIALQEGNHAYICPDDVCLKEQQETYIADIKGSKGTQKARQAAYNKWRPGSNAATHMILANLIRERYAFYFGTTSTGPATAKFFEFLKKQRYVIRLLHISAPDSVRWESIKERDKTFVQTTEEDVSEKGRLLPHRISDTYLKYADHIEFYYRGALKEDAVLAAKWDRRKLTVLDSILYGKIKAIHNAAVKQPELCWENTVEKAL